MDSYRLDDLEITLNKAGSQRFAKVSYPIRYGRYSEIKSRDHIFQFNLNGELKFIRGLGKDWPDPSEWLKRTVGNDWVYYSTGGYGGVFDAFGEYYLPCPAYPSNAVVVTDPFDDSAVKGAIQSWHSLQPKFKSMISAPLPQNIKEFLRLVGQNGPDALQRKARIFHQLIGGPVSVLPPDTRHVDYEVIPITIADGCLYKCGFCRVKSRQDFTPRTKGNIIGQINKLETFYGPDISNYNSIFLGQHDALYCDPDLIVFAAINAYKTFRFQTSNIRGANLFLFGSVTALMDADNLLFDMLAQLPFSTYINIGLESADSKTLAKIKKSITPEAVSDAFAKMTDINRQYEKIEITANFLFGDELPADHLTAFITLTEKYHGLPNHKGAIYFSPLVQGGVETNRGMIRKFYKIKVLSPIPTFIYLIQRL